MHTDKRLHLLPGANPEFLRLLTGCLTLADHPHDRTGAMGQAVPSMTSTRRSSGQGQCSP